MHNTKIRSFIQYTNTNIQTNRRNLTQVKITRSQIARHAAHLSLQWPWRITINRFDEKCHRCKKRQNIVASPSGGGSRPMGRRAGARGPMTRARGGASSDVALRPQLKPFRLQSFTDKPAGWSIIITFRTRDSVIYALPRALPNR